MESVATSRPGEYSGVCSFEKRLNHNTFCYRLELDESGEILKSFQVFLAQSMHIIRRRCCDLDASVHQCLSYQIGCKAFINSFFTITMSEGQNLDIETTAMATLAWLNDQTAYSQNIE